MSKFRGFIAIEINAIPKILEFEREIERTKANVKLENVHITLKFLGDVDEHLIDQIERIMKDAVKGIDPFTIKLRDYRKIKLTFI